MPFRLFQRNNKTSQEETAAAVVFLPGWGFDGRVLEVAEQPLPWYAPEFPAEPAVLLDGIMTLMDRENLCRINLVGWSMGANLALDFARRHPDKIAGLSLLAMRKAWPENEIEAIRRDLAVNLERFMSGFYRKSFLGYKKNYDRFLAGLQERYLREMDQVILSKGLDYLQASSAMVQESIDSEEGGIQGVETYLVHGRRDVIAPVAEMPHLPGVSEQVLEHGGHMFFLGSRFFLPVGEKKGIIKQKFSRAAASYDRHAEIQKDLAGKLATKLPPPRSVESILEIGCGTGNYTAFLAEHFPAAAILALDFSHAMLDEARKKFAESNRVEFLCEDGESFLSGTSRSFDIVTSNATLQWFDDVGRAFAGISRILNTNGMFLCSVFGPRTLRELGAGLSSLFGREYRLPAFHFPDQERLKDLLPRFFTDTDVTEREILRQYGSIHELLSHIKKTGTGGWGEKTPVFTRERLTRLDEWFIKNHGGYSISYQLFILAGRKCEE